MVNDVLLFYPKKDKSDDGSRILPYGLISLMKPLKDIGFNPVLVDGKDISYNKLNR